DRRTDGSHVRIPSEPAELPPGGGGVLPEVGTLDVATRVEGVQISAGKGDGRRSPCNQLNQTIRFILLVFQMEDQFAVVKDHNPCNLSLFKKCPERITAHLVE